MGSSSARAWLASLAALVLIAGVIGMSVADAQADRPVFGLATIALAGALAILAATFALARFSARSRASAEPAAAGRSNYRHLVRLGAVVMVVGVAAAIARALLVPDSYGEFGYWRGNAAREAMFASKPLHQGQPVCAGCHVEMPPAKDHARIAALHDKDVHRTVACETCHGPGADHVASFAKGGDRPGAGTLFVPQTKEPCLWCHRRLTARPSNFPQIDPREHYAFLGVADDATPCTKCHSPHEPLFLQTKLSEARLHPVIQRCRDCHREPLTADARRPDGHPVVFECGYCHVEIAADFAGRSHAALGCDKCHLFHRESETAGRVTKNRAPEFCLLCHRANPFRGPGAPPLINWPPHPNAEGPGMEGVVCVDCHLDKIHQRTADLRRAAAGGDR